MSSAYPEVDEGFGHWLAGFIDGEGTFRISLGPSGCYRCRFALRVRADDVAIIREIHERTGIGKVYFHAAAGEGTPGVGERKPTYGWDVITKADCARLVELIDRFPLRAKKARDYAIWREAAALWLRAIRRGNDWSEMAALSEAIVATRKYEPDHACSSPRPVDPQLRLVS